MVARPMGYGCHEAILGLHYLQLYQPYHGALMKIEHAFSTDVDEIVDIDTAYELFEAGRILDKHNFLCLYPGCAGDITAANLDKLRQDMAVDPYFKRVGDDHTAECDRHGGCEAIASAPDEEARRARGRKDDTLPDQFMLSRPASHEVKVHSVPVGPDEAVQAKGKRRAGSPGDTRLRPVMAYSVGSLVSRFARYRKQGVDALKMLSIKGFRLSYRDMFVPLANLDLKDAAPHWRVYFGRAFVDRKDAGYAITFVPESAVVLEGKKYRPSLFVSDQRIANAYSRTLFERKFKDLSERKRPDAWFFVYGKPEPVERGGKTYVNFNVFNLDYIDFREGFEP